MKKMCIYAEAFRENGMKKIFLPIVFLIMTIFFTSSFSARYTDEVTIMLVQDKLNSENYECGTPDGIMGNNTSQAIFNYQKDHGLTANGMVTEELIEELGLKDLLEEDTTEDTSEAPQTEAADATESNGTYNLLIIGSDRRSSGWYGNSDVIVLMTINPKAEAIFMVSFMRDLYADIPGYGVHKINYSYAAAGPEKLEETLISNFGVHIDNYVAVDWSSTAQIIDMFGGVDIEIKDYEINNLNGLISDVCVNLGLDAYNYYLYSSGMQHLNGVQAVAYSRIRYVGNNDYERTQRQRSVLSSLINTVSSGDKTELMKNAVEILKLTDHDLSMTDIVKLAGMYFSARDYTLITDRVPYDDLYYSQNEMLVPSQPATNERLLGEIYATEKADES